MSWQSAKALADWKRKVFTFSLRGADQFQPRFYGQKNILTASICLLEKKSMDIPYVVAGVLLWVALVLMVKGLEKLEKPKGVRA
jgi:hypothetical protein